MTSDVDTEVPVHVGGVEKWITGLTKRTTCDDVIYAILHFEHGTSGSRGKFRIRDYILCERWENMERPLPGRMKMYKILRSWGPNKIKVKFVLRRLDLAVEPSDAYKSKKYAKYYHRGRYRRKSPDGMSSSCESDTDTGSSKSGKSDSRVKSKAPVVKNGKSDNTNSSSKPEESTAAQDKALKQLVKLVIDQEKKIRSQMDRIKEVDTQIDHYESKLHAARVRENGQNYVQDLYLGEQCSQAEKELTQGIDSEDLDTYVQLCENILDLQSKISGEQGKIQKLSFQLFEESYTDTLENFAGATNTAPLPSRPNEVTETEKVELKKRMERSLNESMCQQNALQELDISLKEYDKELLSKRDCVKDLALELEALEPSSAHDAQQMAMAAENSERTIQFNYLGEKPPSLPHKQFSGGFDINRALLNSNTSSQVREGELNLSEGKIVDTDSDTGLSSMHSVSDEGSQVLETLV